eukprot:CAMPEP_0204903320 /NCGR_PEP_ID=MMETSP1397-20131031/4178_1 /ASSEMBLY_ACC=CAM_ASM_000891 /TAXON_ID=49980 /ORGANISM="Climacostomum Climacostomum virens, Strain Stock W-24" /LENGTH=241 /DNA_ID=CAMNT_0052071929 /DNA_START=717 /DNA_END=1442 /DNA_ORIENTATION=+
MSSLLKTLRMPWLFNTFHPSKTKQLEPLLKKDLLSETEGFIQAYKGYVHALADGNAQYLQKVTEPRLYEALRTSLDMARMHKGKLQVLNPDAGVLSELCNPKLYFEVKNSRKPDNIIPTRTRGMEISYPNRRFDGEDIVYYKKRSFTGAILKVDVVFDSKMKLILQDEQGLEAQGSSSDSSEKHMLTFETNYVASKYRIGIIYDMFKVFAYIKGRKSSWLSKYDWVITDVDEYMLANPENS